MRAARCLVVVCVVSRNDRRGWAQVTADLAYPQPEHVSAPVVAAVMATLVSLCPIISIVCTHPFVAEYESERASPTGLMLSYGSIFW